MGKHVLWSAETLHRFGLRVGPETGLVHGAGSVQPNRQKIWPYRTGCGANKRRTF